MTSRFTYRQREFGSEGGVSSTTVFVADLNVGNITVQEGLADDLIAAIQAVSLGESRGADYAHEIDPGGAAVPTAEQAQRENKWLVSCRETGGGLNAVTFTIPCADLEHLSVDGTNMEAGTPRTDLIAAVEAMVLSNDGEAVVVESIKFRARSR